MSAPVFEFSDYKEYLSLRLSTEGQTRGARSRLAKQLGCQQAFISQVLGGKTHFSLEHAIEIDRFLGHSESETQFFMLLVNLGKAGSQTLSSFYRKQIQAIRKERSRVSKRVEGRRLTLEATHRFYSSWKYGAIHTLLMIPEMCTKEKIAQRLRLSIEEVSDVLDFLDEHGLASQSAGHYKVISHRTHLPGDAPTITKHHSNWRVRALNSLDSKDPFNLHYSGSLALSRQNADKLRKLLLNWIENVEPIIAEPGEEEGYGIALDLFLL